MIEQIKQEQEKVVNTEISDEVKSVDPVKAEAEKLALENKRRETLRHQVVADFVLMCSEFLYHEFLKKLKEAEQKTEFFKSLGE